jgi:hypothetical protein
MARMATEQIAVSPPSAYNLRSRPLMSGGGGFSVNSNAYVGTGGTVVETRFLFFLEESV